MRIFIASSGDLETERKDLRLLCFENKFEPIVWENLDKSITNEKFQDRINKYELNKSDIVIFMIKSRLGKYTQEEFEEAYSVLGLKIKKMYVYFFEINKNNVENEELLKILQLQKFLREEGHLAPNVKNFKDLEIDFLKQKDYFNKKITEDKKEPQLKVDKKELNNKIIKKIAILTCNPLNKKFKQYISKDKIKVFFEKYNLEIHFLTLNLYNLYNLDDMENIFLFTETFEKNITIEDEYLISNNLKINDLKDIIIGYENITFYLFSLNESSLEINTIFNLIPFHNNHTHRFNSYMHKNFKKLFARGKALINYHKTNISEDFNISKDAKTFVGKTSDLRNIVRDILEYQDKNIVYSILGSGGIGKTTIIKKIANLFSDRGFFTAGFYFIDCEHLIDYLDFEEKVKSVFDMNNAIDFINQLKQVTTIDRMIIFDNFETLLYIDSPAEIIKIKSLIFYLTDYSSVVLTTREKISEEFENIYYLNHLTINEAEELYLSINTAPILEGDRKFLRDNILDGMLNKNPLAIKLVAKLKLNVYHLEEELSKNFFEATNDSEIKMIENVFSKESDFNIEKSKSLFYSISLSVEHLKEKHKLIIELLSLFPDGIHKKNFITFYNKKELKYNPNRIDYKDINLLEDKTLIVVTNEFIKLQSIIGRFAEYLFNKNNEEKRISYYNHAYKYNEFILTEVIGKAKKESISIAYKLFDKNKNNYIKSLDYLPLLEENEKKVLYIDNIGYYLSSNTGYDKKVIKKLEYIYDTSKNEKYKKFVLSVKYLLNYFYGDFDNTLNLLKRDFPYEEIFLLDYADPIEKYTYLTASNIYDMEGYQYKSIKNILNTYTDRTNHLLWDSFGEIGAFDIINILKDVNYFNKSAKDFLTYDFMNNAGFLDIDNLLNYKKQLHSTELLMQVQVTYLQFKINSDSVPKNEIEELVITNSFTSGLKTIMLLIKDDNFNNELFEDALYEMYHIKYYYVEGILLYSEYLKKHEHISYEKWIKLGLKLAQEHQYRFLLHKLNCLYKEVEEEYDEKNYPFPNAIDFESFFKKHKVNTNKVLIER